MSRPHQLGFDLGQPEVSPASDWCQRWREGQSSWRHRSEGGFCQTDYEVAPLNDPTAKAYVERHHYTGTYVASRLRYGLWDRQGTLLGVAVLSMPVRRAVLEVAFPALEPYGESLELGRFVLADRVPANGESWFLAQVFRHAAREGLRGVVSCTPGMGIDLGVEVPCGGGSTEPLAKGKGVVVRRGLEEAGGKPASR